MWRFWRKLARRSVKTVFTLLCAAVAFYAFTYLYREFRTDDPFAAQFVISGWDVPAHFFGAGLALLLAPLQLNRRVRRQMPRLHRLSGGLYAAAVLIAAGSGLSLAVNAQGGAASGAGFAMLSLLWAGTTAYGVSRAVAGEFAEHRRWMYRSVALTFSAVTLRVILGLGAGVMHLPFLSVYIAAAWLSWSINLAVCELWLRRTAIRRGVADSRWVSLQPGA